jgi:predicted phage baseplate assembly protein
MISNVTHTADPSLPGDTLHTTIRLAGTAADGRPGLSYRYHRDSVRVHANVVAATHGETIQQVLGSGDATKRFQRFELKRPPLTHVAAPIPAGAAPELEVRVNGTRWRLARSLVDLDERGRGYVIATDDEGVTKVVFGDGATGARPPTGAENVSAEYRTGIGVAGNVEARTIDTLIDRPLGVTKVINPIAASGGADPESRDLARSNAPLAVMALDRLVSVADYADFARTFAGIVKADAQLLTLGRRRILHLTVALDDDGRLDPNGALARNLRQALTDFGDPRLQLVIEERQVRLVVLSARVRISADERWETIEPSIRTRLTGALGFARRELGAGMAASEVIAAIQGTRGVAYVDLDRLDWVDEDRLTTTSVERTELAGRRPSLTRPQTAIAASLAHVDPKSGLIIPAQLAYADASSADAVVLEELER